MLSINILLSGKEILGIFYAVCVLIARFECMFRLSWMLAVALEFFLFFVLRLVQNG